MVKPIAMKCSLEQYDEIKPILLENGFELDACTNFSRYPYLVNNDDGHFKIINNYDSSSRNSYGRTAFEEWDKDVFLEYCGIFVLPEKWWVKRTSDTAEMINEYFNSLNPHYEYCYNPHNFWDAMHSEAIDTSKRSPHSSSKIGEHSIEPGFTEITFEQFQKYVLKQNQKSMRKLTVPITDVLEIHKMACRDWKSRIASHLTRVDANQNITFSEKEIDEMFSAATTDQKPVLIKIFGEKTPYKVGDWVLLSNTANGWGSGEEINNKILQITEINLDYQQSEGGKYYLGGERTVGKCIVRLATAEEIEKATKPVIEWDKLKTGSIVKIKKTGEHCSGFNEINANEPVDIVFFKTRHIIKPSGQFQNSAGYPLYCTFHQNGKFILFSAHTSTDYITEVIEY